MLIRWSFFTIVLTCGFSFGWLQIWPIWQEQATQVALAKDSPTLILQPNTQVLITGAVKKPGLYRLPKGALVYELVQRAGGLKPNAKVNHKLLAQIVPKGGSVEIPVKKLDTPVSQAPEAKLKTTQPQASSKHSSFNLNTCSLQDLQKVPGIGPKLAERIMAYRSEHGAFSQLSDLRKVKGIGAKRFEKIQGYFK